MGNEINPMSERETGHGVTMSTALMPIPRVVWVDGGTLPKQVSYLHALIAAGQGDDYNWRDRRVTIKICAADVCREPALKDMAEVTFEY